MFTMLIMGFLRNSFLLRVYQKDKVLAATIVSVMLLHAIVLYHLWSHANENHPISSVTTYQIVIDKRLISSNKFLAPQRHIVYQSLAQYPLLGGRDTSYQRWLFSYIADMRMVQTPEINVTRNQVTLTNSGQIVVDSTSTLVFHLRDE